MENNLEESIIEKIELLIHPVRLRILQSLLDGPKNTQQIAQLLPSIPKSTLYRHMKLLLDGGAVEVSDTRLVQGILEKDYRLRKALHLVGDDVANLTLEEHLDYFTTYIVTLLQAYSEYLNMKSKPDMAGDRAGYSEVVVWASDKELDTFAKKLNEALSPLLENQRSVNRHLHKFAIIAHPVRSPGEQDE